MAGFGAITGIQGRMGRLAYLLAYLALSAAMGGMVFLGLQLVGLGGLSGLLGKAIIWASLGGGGYGLVVIMGRRLHDLGMSAGNLLWVVPLQLAAATAQGSELLHDSVELGLAVFAFLVALWILLAPGQPRANDHGPALR